MSITDRAAVAVDFFCPSFGSGASDVGCVSGCEFSAVGIFGVGPAFGKGVVGCVGVIDSWPTLTSVSPFETDAWGVSLGLSGVGGWGCTELRYVTA